MIKYSRQQPAIFLYLKIIFAAVFFFTIFAAVDFFFLVSQYEDVGKFLLDGCDTAGIFTFQYILDLLWECEGELLSRIYPR